MIQLPHRRDFSRKKETNMNYGYLKDVVFRTLKFNYGGEIEFAEKSGVYASLKGGKAVVGGENEISVCRALTEFAKKVSEGCTDFEIVRKANFEYCGAMLDVSRYGVLKVETVKKYLDKMACLGLNMLMLYTEDVFEMEKYPYFGHRRGRYTIEELKAIDDYAYSLGIEVIPCVQTLGHLNMYLPWAESGPFKDNDFNIMPCSPKSYEFVEEILKTMRKAFRSDHIHIGMDEAVNVGRGNYFNKHRGEVIDQRQLILDHLRGVCEICEKYDYKPMIWSDMFFSISKPDAGQIFTNDMYLSEETKALIPDVRLVYWYYSSQSETRYANLIRRHKESGKPMAFAGGGWSWEGYAPNNKFTFDTAIPALKACIDEKAEMVINTLWGDSGSECSYSLCYPSNALYAEYNYKGNSVSEEDVWSMCEFLTGVPKRIYDAVETLSYGQYGNVKPCRKLIRRDVFDCIMGVNDNYIMENMPDLFGDDKFINDLLTAASELDSYAAKIGDDAESFTLVASAMKISAAKGEIFRSLRKDYKSGDRAKLAYYRDELLPKTKALYEKLYLDHKAQWMKENKAFGWEFHCRNIGYQIMRMSYAIETIDDYLNGRISVIEELEPEFMNQNIQEYDHTMFD